jgi:predicted  nucleic acid-binding Zn-ribbon protein
MVGYATNSLGSEYEVDYDKNITALYESITSCDWDVAIEAVTSRPKEARTWVVRHYEDSEDIMWRFLPIHSACARQPPASVISALLKAYPEGARCIDDQGMYALHYACGNQASREVIRLLLVANPQAAKAVDPRGMLPIHYLACWGPSSVSIVDMVLVANRDVGSIADADGNTALDLALQGEYPERDAVVSALKRWFEKSKQEEEAPENQSMDAAPGLTRSASGESGASPLTVSRLRQEVTKLRAAQKKRDEDFDKTMNQSVSSLKSQCYDLEKQVHSATSSLVDAQDKIESMEGALNRKQRELREKDEKIEELNSKLYRIEREHEENLREIQRERDELRQTLAEVTSDCDMYKKKADHMNDRIGSLSASLSSMMEQQAELMKKVEARESKYSEIAALRRTKLQAMLDMEERFVGDSKYGDDSGVAYAFEKQAKEMDAISAVIAAMRN